MKRPLTITPDANTRGAFKKNILSTMNSIISEVKSINREINSSEEMEIEDILVRIEPQTEFIGELMDLSQVQVLILAACLEECSRRSTDLSEIAERLHVNYLRLMEFNEDLTDLVRKKLIRMDKENNISIPREVLKCFRENKPYQAPAHSGLTTRGIMRCVDEMFSSLCEGEIEDAGLLDEAKAIIEENQDTAFAKGWRKHSMDEKPTVDQQLFLFMSAKLVIDDDDRIMRHQVQSAFECDIYSDHAIMQLSKERLVLQKENIIEFGSEGEMRDKSVIRITDSVKRDFFSDAGVIGSAQEDYSAEIIHCNTVTPRELFYNDREKKQISVLEDMLSPERYLQVCTQLKTKGLRTGFSCLFYGGPGTGKTETVYQIARRTGRDLMMVDVSRIKSCWVGESEKNIKGLFADYRRMVKERETAPILLFNEADAVFGIRQEGAQRAVDKMENSIQNIILQEMEDLDGILIATTNLTGNLDKAFERRFLYKILFDRPSVEAKALIWQSMLPELSAAEARELSESFDFSGGQIENISRKKSIQEIIDGTAASFDSLKEFCSEEVLDKGGKGRRIGY